MKILITGGAGFIGSHLSTRHLNDGHEVVIVDNLDSGKAENIPADATFYNCSILNAEWLKDIIAKEKPDIISHHAAQTGVRASTQMKRHDAELNVIGTINLIDACVVSNVKKIIYPSSGGTGYGEPEYLPIKEDHPQHPISVYGCSKVAGELYLRHAHAKYGIKYTTLRYSNVYGPGQKDCGITAIFPNLLLQDKKPRIFGDGGQTRDYVYISDVVEANVLALESEGCEIYNIGTGVETSLNELYALCQQIIGNYIEPYYAPANAEELQRNALDSTKAIRELGWHSWMTLERGMELVIEEAHSKNDGR